ncbi:Solute carrier family 2 facilitated glucose transporter member 3 [Trichostrongylus colubriformis]|uniref:Solute carrier family 2 facilitated glucose transporter member 3 n=1 Tax=Trichostrongylus colubriformis TaxID=6319 RepID=A0AAN8FU07_TRICO
MFAPKGRMLNCLLVFGSLGAVVNFPEGYSNSYPNTSYKSFQRMINDSYINRGDEHGISPNIFIWVWSAILNVWFIGYLLGTFVTPYFTEKYGRRKTLFGANIVAFVGAALAFLSIVFMVPELFFFSRVVASFSSGVSFGALILFLQEATPTEYRGMTSFLSENTFIATTVMGIGFGMDAVFGNKLPALTGIAMIPAAISVLLVIPLRETPKFLLLNKNDRNAAMESLRYYRGDSPDLDAILDEMLLEIDDKPDKKPSILSSAITVLREPHLRTPFFIGCLCLQVVIGIWSIIYLSTDMLMVHFSPQIAQIASLLFILSNFIAGMGGMFIIERFGRRTLVLRLGILNTISLALYVLFDQLTAIYNPFKWGTIIALMLFGITYGVGLGPIAFFITSELVNQQHRSLVQSMVFAVNTIANFAFTFATLPAYTAIQSWSFIPLFIIPSTFSLIYLYFNMPETVGREVHEIVEELMTRTKQKVSTTKSNAPLYFCDIDIRKRKEEVL